MLTFETKDADKWEDDGGDDGDDDQLIMALNKQRGHTEQEDKY